MEEDCKYIQARKDQLHFYRDVPLYTKVNHSKFVLYKSSGITLDGLRIEEGRHPKVLFVRQSDLLKGLKEAQKALHKILETQVKSGDPEKVKKILVTLVTETLTEPRKGSLETFSDTVNILASNYAKQANMIKLLLGAEHTDYSIALHSINVMVYALSFALYHNYSQSDSIILGLCALLHDVGKTKISHKILTSPRKLTDSEFGILQNHTTLGYQILNRCMFTKQEIGDTALDHHEKLDGSGYPNGKIMVSPLAQLIGLIDCYELLTNDGRPYRQTISGFKALDEFILKDVKNGRFSPKIYSQFVRSLGGVAPM